MQSKASSGEQLDYTSGHDPLSTTMLQRVSVHSGLSMPVQPLCRHWQHKTKKPSSPSALEAEGTQCKEVVLGSGHHAEPSLVLTVLLLHLSFPLLPQRVAQSTELHKTLQGPISCCSHLSICILGTEGDRGSTSNSPLQAGSQERPARAAWP